jgi:hypothetical protein
MGEKYRTNPFFNGVSSFKTAFPDLADALIEWRERKGPEDPKPGDLKKTGFRRGNLTQGVLACSNPTCHEGGYEVDRLIAVMLSLGETERSGTLLCSGREVAEEVRRGPIRCTHRMEYTVTLTPKAEERRPETRKEPPKDARTENKGRARRGRHRPRRQAPAPAGG